jgi:hypothetical protein
MKRYIDRMAANYHWRIVLCSAASAMQRNTASGRRLMDHEAIELVRSIRNRCDLLLSEAVRHELPYAVYTLCEDLAYRCTEAG